MYPQLFDRRSMVSIPSRQSQPQGLPVPGSAPAPVAVRPSPPPPASPAAPAPRPHPIIFRHGLPGFIPSRGFPVSGAISPLLLMKLGFLGPVSLVGLTGRVRRTVTIYELRGSFGDPSSYEISGIDPATGWFSMPWADFVSHFRPEYLVPAMQR